MKKKKIKKKGGQWNNDVQFMGAMEHVLQCLKSTDGTLNKYSLVGIPQNLSCGSETVRFISPNIGLSDEASFGKGQFTAVPKYKGKKLLHKHSTIE